MSYTITKESTGKVLVTHTALLPEYIPNDCVVAQTEKGVAIKNRDGEHIANYSVDSIAAVNDGSTTSNPTTATELFNALKTVFSAGGSSSSTTETGWADYSDTQYIQGSPLTVTPTQITLPNNAGNVVDSQKPSDIATFYDSASQLITGRNGDGLNIVIEFKVAPSDVSTDRVVVSIDIGGAVGEIYKRDFTLTKGVGVQHFYLSSFAGYTLNTWEANGGAVKINSVGGDATVWDIRYVLTRTHKSR